MQLSIASRPRLKWMLLFQTELNVPIFTDFSRKITSVLKRTKYCQMPSDVETNPSFQLSTPTFCVLDYHWYAHIALITFSNIMIALDFPPATRYYPELKQHRPLRNASTQRSIDAPAYWTKRRFDMLRLCSSSRCQGNSRPGIGFVDLFAVSIKVRFSWLLS